MRSVGVIGLGIMGGGIALNFLKKGREVSVWNRTEEVSERYREKGASVRGSPAEVARNSDIVFEVTANDESSRSVWLGEKGILAGARKGSVLIASSTLSVAWVDELAKRCEEAGLEFMDAALTGGRVGAEGGTLTLLCGGKGETLIKIGPDLEAIARQRT